jgi:hypothetical protein
LFKGVAFKDETGRLVVVSRNVDAVGDETFKADLYTGKCEELLPPQTDVMEFSKMLHNTELLPENAVDHAEKYIN